MKISFNSEDDLVLSKQLKMYNVVILIRSALNQNDKCYLSVFLDECSYKFGKSIYCCLLI